MEAQHKLGICYGNGLGIEQDYKQALYWYEKAANQGCVIAKYNIAALCTTKDIEERNLDYEWSLLKEVLYSEESSKKNGFLMSIFKLIYDLGELYESQDNKESFDKAITCYEELFEIATQLEYERYKIRTLEKLVFLGARELFYVAANACREGKYIDKDSGKARYYLMKEIELKRERGQFIKACLCLGDADWFIAAEEMQEWINLNAEWQKEGNGVIKNGEEAFQIFTYLAKWNNTDALWGLALCYHFGLGTKPDAELALDYLRQFKLKQSSCDMLRGLDVSVYEQKFAYPALKKYLKAYEANENNYYTEENNTYKNLRVPDLSAFFENKEQAYRCAVEFDFGEDVDKSCAIMVYSYAAILGSKKALYTLINMAMEQTEYFIDVIDLMDGGEE